MGMLSRLNAQPLTAEAVATEVQNVVRRILAERNAVRIVLFGSAARGEANEASDLDFCVVLDSEEEIRGARRALYRDGFFTSMSVDILWFTEVSYREAVAIGGVGSVIEREGRILYRRGAT